MIVYCFVNLTNGKRYVGITDRTLDYRWGKHVVAAQNGSDYHFHRAIRKHGDVQFEGVVLEECSSIEELKDAERRWVWLLVSNHPERGYNMTEGGDGVFGLKMTKATRLQMSKSHQGKKHTPEQRQKISEAMKRRYEDPSERQRTSDALMKDEVRRKMQGRVVSEETRRKMSVAARKRWLNKEQNEVMI